LLQYLLLRTRPTSVSLLSQVDMIIWSAASAVLHGCAVLRMLLDELPVRCGTAQHNCTSQVAHICCGALLDDGRVVKPVQELELWQIHNMLPLVCACKLSGSGPNLLWMQFAVIQEQLYALLCRHATAD
jgi:hypothetical protein